MTDNNENSRKKQTSHLSSDGPPSPPTQEASVRTWSLGSLTYTKVGLATLFSWLLFGDVAFMLRERSAAPVAQLMLKHFQASDLLTGLFLVTIPQAIIFILGPVISYWSDRHRGRWGRRIPFLLIPTPFVSLAMVALGFSPVMGASINQWMGISAENANSTVLGLMTFFWTIFEIGVVITNSVFNGLVNDVVPREWLGRFYGMFRAVGLAVGVFFNQLIIGKVEQHFTLFFVCIGVLYGIGFTVMCLRVKEGQYSPPSQHAAGKRLVMSAVGDYYRDCLSQKYYLWVFCFIGLSTAAFLPVNTFAIYAAKSYGMDMGTYGRYLVATFACSFLLSLPIGWLVDKYHAIRVGQVSLALYASLMLVGFFMTVDQSSFGIALLVHGIVSGVYWTGTAAIGQMLFPKQKFAQYAAAAGLFQAAFSMIIAPLLGLALDQMGNAYKYTFLVGGSMAGVSLLLGWKVHRQWLENGGYEAYIAPAPIQMAPEINP
jgi:MFS family permease